MGAGASITEDKGVNPASPSPQKRNNSSNQSSSQVGDRSYPTFDVSLGFWPGNTVTLPDRFKLRIAYESLDFIRSDDESPLIQFPFQNIICWGSS
eukprot:gene28912-32651_t